MANSFQQVIELALRSTTDPNVRALLTTLADVGDVADLTDEQVAKLTGEVERLTKELADTAATRDAVAAYAELSKTQTELADAVERGGLALKLTTAQEAAAASVLEEKNRALDAAKQQQAEYAQRSDRLVLVERELAAAVKDATVEQKQATQEWKSAGADLARATTGYEKAAEAQGNVQHKLAALESTISAAKLSTSDLAGAQRELAARSGASEKALADLTAESRQAAGLATELANETKHYRAEQDATADAIARHRAKMAEARSETEKLGASTKEATGIFASLRGVLAKVVGVVSFASIVQGLRAIIGAGSDAEQSMAQLDAALASTGNKAGLTSDELLKLANSLRSKSLFNTDQIVAAETRLLSYTDIAGKEFPRALQIAIDQAQRLGISTEQSAEIVGKALQSPAEAMSALSRQGFKLEDGQKQLLQQLEATGRTAEAQAIIMDMLSESYGGSAAASRFNTFKGIWKGIADQFDDFLGSIADSGALDGFKKRLKEFSDQLAGMVNNGQAAEWAKKIADGIVSATDAMARGVRFVFEYAGAIRSLVETYLILRAIKIASSFLEAAAASEVAAKGARKAAADSDAFAKSSRAAQVEVGAYKAAVGKLTGILNKFPQVVRFSILAIGLDFTLNKLVELKAALDEQRETNSRAKEINEDLQNTYSDLALKIQGLKEAFQEYADVSIRSNEDLRASGEEQLVAYQQQLEGAKRYFEALKAEARLARDAVALKGAEAAIAEVASAIAAVNAQLAATRAVGKEAAAGLNEAASAIAVRLKSVSSAAKETKEALESIFVGFDLKGAAAGVGDFALAFDVVTAKSGKASDTLKSGLLATLRDLSGQDLLRFQMAASTAIDGVGATAAKNSEVLKATLEVALDRLGVKAEDTGVKITKAGTDTIATLLAIAQNSQATAKQITAAFDAALGSARTKEEAKALGEALELAYGRGAISARQLADATRELNERVRTITANITPLRSQFELLGIKSQAQLVAMRENARAAFEAVVDGARRGEAAQEDVRRAFVAYAEAAKAAAEDSNASTKSQVALLLEIQATSYGLSDALEKTGIVGQLSGEKTAKGFESAKKALDDTADAADKVGERGSAAAEEVSNIGSAASSATVHLSAASSELTNIIILTAEQNRLLRSAGEEFARGQITAEEYGRRVQAAMTGVDDALRRQEESLSRFQDALDDVNSEIAQLTGDQSGDESIRHERRLRDLQEEFDTNTEMTRAQYQQLVAAENRLHALKMDNIRKQQQQQRSDSNDTADTGGRPGGSIGGNAAGFGSSAGVSATPQINVSVQGSIIGGTPAQLSEALARLIKPELERIARRSL